MKRTNYSVSWEVEVEAENEIEAAKEAKRLMQDKDSGLLYFLVQSYQREFTKRVSVDLNLNITHEAINLEETEWKTF